MTGKWEARGKKLVDDLQATKDNQTIESLAKSVVAEIIETYDAPNSRKIPLSTVRKAVLTAFPDTKKETTKNQYLTSSGKGNIARYSHLALKYLTFSKEDWDALGDDARKAYEVTKATGERQIETITEFSLSDMKIEQLELDTETKQTVLDALEQSGKSLAEFIQQACKIYAKTITGKVKKYGENDISTVLTADLLDADNKDYKTHPKKIEELTKRAIVAITRYNDEIATELNQKWFISGTAINGLTGSRVQSVNEILKDYKEIIDTHNNKHGLTAYTNRGNGRRIEQDIDLPKLVPDGLNL